MRKIRLAAGGQRRKQLQASAQGALEMVTNETEDDYPERLALFLSGRRRHTSFDCDWSSDVCSSDLKRVTVRVARRLRPREPVPDLWLLFAPIKRGRIDWLVEKATELGVARLMPVITRRTIVERLNLDRLRAHSIEAAEQCERTALPVLEAPAALDKVLAAWPAERALFFADESGGAPLAAAARPGPAAILI